jgi:hypothetical protein
MSYHPLRSWLALVCSSLTLAAGFTAPAAAKSAPTRLATADASIGARVGASVDIDRDYLVLGAPDDQEAGPFAGAVYVFERQGQTWKRVAKLLGPATSGFREFGEAVAISGTTLVVGAPFDGPAGESRGAAYVYARKGKQWTLEARLTASDSALNQLFGDAVAISDSTIVVGAFLDSELAPNAGAVYVFERVGSTWTQRAKLTASNASEFAFFGSALAIEGKTLLVGSPIAGMAYVFGLQGATWTEQAILSAFDQSPADYNAFGSSVALDDSTLIIGAPLDGAHAPNAGAAYTFTKKDNTWTAQSKLLAPDGAGSDEFGTSVAVEDKQAAVGAPYHGEANSGAVYLFQARGNEWRVNEKAAGTSSDAFLGASVALRKKSLVGGAPGFVDFGGTQSAGAGYVFPTR